ncbi:MAG TPA: hypothetical protein VGX28_10890 [Frankiaceae bacterium]|nr:hypothetical protein [Frankiaceae bacterium]
MVAAVMAVLMFAYMLGERRREDRPRLHVAVGADGSGLVVWNVGPGHATDVNVVVSYSGHDLPTITRTELDQLVAIAPQALIALRLRPFGEELALHQIESTFYELAFEIACRDVRGRLRRFTQSLVLPLPSRPPHPGGEPRDP